MRNQLRSMNQTRCRFKGIFERYGTKRNWNGFDEKTVLLKDIRRGDKVVSDHLWFSMTKGFAKLGELKQGDVIEFDARVTSYLKGYRGYREDVQIERPPEIDYRLSFPTKFKIINQDGKPEATGSIEVFQ